MYIMNSESELYLWDIINFVHLSIDLYNNYCSYYQRELKDTLMLCYEIFVNGIQVTITCSLLIDNRSK